MIYYILWHCDNGCYNVYDCKKVIDGKEHHGGTLMDSDRLYTDRKGAELFINRDYARANEYLYFKEVKK